MDGRWSVAWRVHDAQFWGVPQRRRRISLVADFGGGTAHEILFERKSVSWDPAEGFRSWQATPGNSADRSGTTGIGFDGHHGSVTGDKSSTLGVNCGMSTGRNGVMVLENHSADSRVTVSDDGKVQTLTSRMDTGGGNVPLVMEKQPTAYVICSKDSYAMKSDNPHSGIYKADVARTLDLNGGSPACNQG